MTRARTSSAQSPHPPRVSGAAEKVVIGSRRLTIEDVAGIAEGSLVCGLRTDDEFRDWIDKGSAILERHWRNSAAIYGVTTGVGENCMRPIPVDLVKDFSRQLAEFHGCGLGDHLDPVATTATLVVRMVSLARGYSAVRYQLLERLCRFVEEGVCPLIPQEGSVGASGDLTPLSYVAALLLGEREALFRGQVRSAGEIHAILGIEPLELLPKEGLAIMNGTSVMTALACLAFMRAERLARLSSRLTAIVCLALDGNKHHFDRRIFEQKPHRGQLRIGMRIAFDLGYEPSHEIDGNRRIQDTYALRCAPHIIGVLEDALPAVRMHIENEINSSNDNPLIDPDTGEILHGGNFYGGHVAFAMDSLKIAVANVADLMDRQIALLMNPHRNHGLPLNLSGASEYRSPVNHGFKAVEIGCSAWAAEALKLTMPASVFSRSTEAHNQDKVSMGTIAARDAIRVLELTEQVLAGCMFAAVQALDCRMRKNDQAVEDLGAGVQASYDQVREITAFVEEDRALEHELRHFLRELRRGAIDCQWPDEIEQGPEAQ